jgi:hypothetical protein
MVGLTLPFVMGAGFVASMAYARAAGLGRVGADLGLYLNATRRWIGGEAFYPAHQLAPYTITDGDILYPPSTIPLFAAFLALPAVLFWVIPLGVVGWVLLRYRPAPWTWPLLALCLAYPPTMVKIVHGNPFMWTAAACALGTEWGWPSVFVLLKPSLAPFALIGMQRRAWWLAALGLGMTALAFAPLWPQYASVLLNGRGGGLLYSIQDVPLLLVPVLAWVGRSGRVAEGVRHRVALAPHDGPQDPDKRLRGRVALRIRRGGDPEEGRQPGDVALDRPVLRQRQDGLVGRHEVREG